MQIWVVVFLAPSIAHSFNFAVFSLERLLSTQLNFHEIKCNSIHKNQKQPITPFSVTQSPYLPCISRKKKVVITKNIMPRLAVSSNMWFVFFF